MGRDFGAGAGFVAHFVLVLGGSVSAVVVGGVYAKELVGASFTGVPVGWVLGFALAGSFIAFLFSIEKRVCG